MKNNILNYISKKNPTWKPYPYIATFYLGTWKISIRKVSLLEIQYFPSRQVGYYNHLCFLCFEIHWPPNIPKEIK